MLHVLQVGLKSRFWLDCHFCFFSLWFRRTNFQNMKSSLGSEFMFSPKSRYGCWYCTIGNINIQNNIGSTYFCSAHWHLHNIVIFCTHFYNLPTLWDAFAHLWRTPLHQTIWQSHLHLFVKSSWVQNYMHWWCCNVQKWVSPLWQCRNNFLLHYFECYITSGTVS